MCDVEARFFETVAPSGVLKPGTAPVDGIFVGGEDVDTTDFVGVDNGGYVGKTPDNCLHAELSYEAITSEWSNRFCANERGCTHTSENTQTDGRLTRDGAPHTARLALALHPTSTPHPLQCALRKGHLDGGALRPDLPSRRAADDSDRLGPHW